MTPDLLDDLRQANPVSRDELQMSTPLAARVLRGIETRAEGAGQRRARRLVTTLGPLVAVAAAAVALLLARGESPDLAARAYAATTGAGIVHWRTDLLGYSNGHLGSHQRAEGWALGDVTHILRSDIIHGKAHVTVDERDAGRRSRVWMSGTNDWISTSRPATSKPLVEPVPSGDPMAAFRGAYRAGRLHDLGGGRFEVRLPHVPAGGVVYEVDRQTGQPRRLVVRTDIPARAGRPASRSLTVVRFSVYEKLAATKANRDKLALLPHAGAGPGTESASRYFAALRTGAAPTGAQAIQLQGLARHMRRFDIDPDGIRALADGAWLMPGRGYICLATSVRMGAVGARLGAGCVTIRKAIENGIATGLPTGVTIAVPDGVKAIEARLHWHGPWQRYTVANGLARLPGLGYQFRLVH